MPKLAGKCPVTERQGAGINGGMESSKIQQCMPKLIET